MCELVTDYVIDQHGTGSDKIDIKRNPAGRGEAAPAL